MDAPWLNSLLYQAMTTPHATDPDVFFEAVQHEVLHARGHLGRQIDQHFDEDSLLKWLRTHVADLDELRSGRYIAAFCKADRRVIRGDNVSVLEQLGLESKESILVGHELMLGFDDYRTRWEILDKLRQRLRWIWILYEGLAKDPVLIPSGEQQVRMRPTHINHPAQTQQDALNEFAGKLVHPSEQHVAHVRMPQSYHEVRLGGPKAGIGPPGQVRQVRRRSQEEYHRPDRGNKPEGPDYPHLPPQEDFGPEGPRITRRPRKQRPTNRE
jgi:hypothetical protein